jgi:hypothetical protein
MYFVRLYDVIWRFSCFLAISAIQVGMLSGQSLEGITQGD